MTELAEAPTDGGGQANTDTPPVEAPAGNWLNELPEDIRGSEYLKDIDGPGPLATKHVELAKTHADLKATLPEVPATPDEYQFTLPDGFPVDETEMGNFKAKAHELGMPNDKAAGMLNFYIDYYNRGIQAMEAQKASQLEAAQAKLDQAWGVDKDANIALVDKTVERFGGQELIEELEKLGLTRNPVSMQMFYNIGKAMSEAALVEGHGPTARTGPPRAEDGGPMLDFSKSMPNK
jgi:hypothetical protein